MLSCSNDIKARGMAEKVATTATITTYTAAGSTGFLGLLTFNEWALVISIGLGFLTYITNLIFKIRMERIVRDKK